MWTLGNAGMGALQVVDSEYHSNTFVHLLAETDVSGSLLFRDWQKIVTQQLLLRHPRLSMN